MKSIKNSIAEAFMKLEHLPDKQPSGKSVVISKVDVVLFFSCYSIEEFDEIQLFLKNNLNRNIRLDHALVYANFKGAENHNVGSNCKLITQNDFNVFGGVKQKLKDYLSNNKSEVLISFANKPDLFCHKIISHLFTDFKAGKFNEANVNLFDLTIKDNIKDYNKSLNHFVQYLNNLKINI